MIPKVVVQTSRKAPNVYRVAKIKEYCPGYEYEHYTDDDIKQFFIEHPDNKFPNLVKNFDKIPMGAWRADYFRYYYLWKKGGVYMDTDLMLNMNIEEIIKNYKFVSVSSNKEQAFNGFISTVSDHPILYLCFLHIYQLYEITPPPPVPYHFFVKAFLKIINRFKSEVHRVDMSLQEYLDEDIGISTIRNLDGEAVMYHYYRHKEFPVTFLTKSDDHC